jgi:alkylation response protein AidB-like acyl-CoA dehydrogenase
MTVPLTPGPPAAAPADLDGYRARLRAWLESHLEPRTSKHAVSGLDPGREFTPETVTIQRRLQRSLFEAGYAGITWPAEYGGQGLDSAHERVFGEEARRFLLPDFGLAGKTSLGVCAPTMLAHASPEFLRRHIPAMLAGDEIFVEFFSEPEAGSDLAGVRTRAERDSDGRWHLNGSKIWSSGAYYADYGMCLARTDWDAPKHAGLTMFALPIRQRGIEVRQIEMLNGARDFCQEYLTDVRVPDTHRVGEVGQGWTVATRLLFHERMQHNSPYVTSPADARQGTAEASPAAIARDAGRLADPLARDLVGQARTLDLAGAALQRRVAAGIRSGQLPDTASAVARLFFTLAQVRAGEIKFELAGGAGAAWDETDGAAAGVGDSFLIRQAGAIGGGTSEMARNVIAERVLGLPRETARDRGIPFRDVPRGAAR